MENGVVTHLDEGVPQGGPVSPVLSNVYLHYVLDLWFERRFKKTCRGFAELTRFADDYVATFQNQTDAERFRREMEERLTAFGLRVAPGEDSGAALRREPVAKARASRPRSRRPSLSLALPTIGRKRVAAESPSPESRASKRASALYVRSRAGSRHTGTTLFASSKRH